MKIRLCCMWVRLLIVFSNIFFCFKTFNVSRSTVLYKVMVRKLTKVRRVVRLNSPQSTHSEIKFKWLFCALACWPHHTKCTKKKKNMEDKNTIKKRHLEFNTRKSAEFII